MKSYLHLLPWAAAGLVCLYLVSAMTQRDDPYREVRNLTVVDGGRFKPFDTFARIQLMSINNRQDFKDEKGKTQPAAKWALDVMTSRLWKPGDEKVAVTDARVLELIEATPEAGKAINLRELFSKGEVVQRLHEEAGKVRRKVEEWTESEKAIVELDDRLTPPAERYAIFRIESDQVRNMLGLPPKAGLRYAINEFKDLIPKVEAESNRASKLEANQRDLFDVKILELAKQLHAYIEIGTWQAPLMIPPLANQPADDWKNFLAAVVAVREGRENNPATLSLFQMLNSYADGSQGEFKKQLADLKKVIAGRAPREASIADFEVGFNHFAPFYQATGLYVLVFLCVVAYWMFLSEPMRQTAFAIAVLTFALHTGALIARMYIQGRPPVTNLYSSAVFIGWGCVGLGLFLEWIYRNGVGLVVAAVLGFKTMLIAHHLGGSGDTLEMMQAVLDTNFWLATHVVCVTLGYTATFVAGFLAIAYVVVGVLSRYLTRDTGIALGQAIYGTVCFALLLSFLGTVLGGIWADQSWGRFWGWDPKENGALLIVIWNALILHARWSGMIKVRGMALLAIAGNMITAWSWFGTNQLGVGLHAYGFNNTLAVGCAIFWISQMGFILLGSIPQRWWMSYQAGARGPKPPDDDGPTFRSSRESEPLAASS